MSNQNIDVEDPEVKGSLRELTAVWWMLLLTGALSLIAGVVVLLEPAHSLATLSVVAGIFVLIDSLVEVAHVIMNRSSVSMGVFAVIGAVIGLLLIRYPIHSVTAVALLVGLWLVAIGVLRLVNATTGPRDGWSILVGALELAGGVVIVASPGIGVATLALLVGLSFILNGIGMLIYAWALRWFRKQLAES